MSNDSSSSNGYTSWFKWLVGIIIALLAAGGGIVALLNYFIPPEPTPTPTEHVQPSQDRILRFRVAEMSGTHAVLEIDYTYDPVHGEQVYVGAWLLRDGEQCCGSAYVPTLVPTVGKGTATLPISSLGLERAEDSDELEISLYEYGKPGEPFVIQRFPFAHRWGP